MLEPNYDENDKYYNDCNDDDDHDEDGVGGTENKYLSRGYVYSESYPNSRTRSS